MMEKKKAKQCEKVNYLLLSNKDGKFAWRPFEIISVRLLLGPHVIKDFCAVTVLAIRIIGICLCTESLIHPALYVALVHKITEKSNWNLIINRFKDLHKNDKIKCLSMPVESISDEKDKAALFSPSCHRYPFQLEAYLRLRVTKKSRYISANQNCSRIHFSRKKFWLPYVLAEVYH
jgi:hypothetical protein